MVLVYYLDDIIRPQENSLHGIPVATNGDFGHLLGGGTVKGKYEKVEGLIFDPNCPNFNPMGWSCPITKDITNIDLELCAEGYDGIDNVTTYALHIHRHMDRDTSMLLSTCEDIAGKYSCVRGEGWGSVGGMFSAGYNVGYKGRISPVAKSTKMKKMPSSFAHSITNRLSLAGDILQHEFGDKNVGFDEMVLLQKEFWPKNRTVMKGPVCWIVSQDLGNPKHVDDDFSRSYAGWFTKEPIGDKSAWFLFPNWGVAIELCNDTWISWDGINCPHCSSVPRLEGNNHIYSLFTAITKKVYTNAERVNACETLLQNRVCFESLRLHEHVTLRWVPPLKGNEVQLYGRRRKRKYGNKYRRWLHCVIVSIDYLNGTIKLRERNKNKRKLPKVTKKQVHNNVVCGWV